MTSENKYWKVIPKIFNIIISLKEFWFTIKILEKHVCQTKCSVCVQSIIEIDQNEQKNIKYNFRKVQKWLLLFQSKMVIFFTWLSSSAVSSPLVTASSLMKEPLEAFEMTEALSLNGVSSSEPLEPPVADKTNCC